MTQNDCERWRELAALRLYDELEDDERVRLEIHLSGCAGCRAQVDELERGLGRLRAQPTAAPVVRVRPWLASALAFAAGVVCALGFSFVGRAPSASTPVAEAAPAFARSTPPPRAPDRGLGVALASLARR